MSEKVKNEAKRHHYVPELLLKKFASRSTNKTAHVFCYDKKEEKVFETEIGNILSLNGFYNIDSGQEKFSIESNLEVLEAAFANSIEKIFKTEDLKVLNSEDCNNIAQFVAVQNFRTLQQKEIVKNLSGAIKPKSEGPVSEEELNAIFISQIGNFKKIAPMILQKEWVLFKSEEDKLYLGDHPVVLHNMNDFGVYGNLGFGLPGIEIYLPISSNYALGFICKSIHDKARAEYKKALANEMNTKARVTLSPNINEAILKKIDALSKAQTKLLKGIYSHLESVDNKTPVILSKDGTTFLNSLQVSFSNRFVISPENTFELVKRMLNDDSRYKRGLMPIID